MQSVVFDICFSGCIRFGRPLGTQDTDTALLYRSEEVSRRFLRTKRTDL
jgi:hypothetical protein